MVYECDALVALRRPPQPFYTSSGGTDLRQGACQEGWPVVQPPAAGRASWEQSPPCSPSVAGGREMQVLGLQLRFPLSPLPAVLEDRVWLL